MRYAKTRITMLITALHSGQLRAKYRCQMSMLSITQLLQFPHTIPYNFECIRFALVLLRHFPVRHFPVPQIPVLQIQLSPRLLVLAGASEIKRRI